MIFDLSKQLLDDLHQVLLQRQAETQTPEQLKHLIEIAIKRCDLVTREEFDAQSAVLARTRERLEALEKVVAEWEARA